MNNPMIWAVPTVPISAGEAKCVRTMSGTREPRMIKSMTSKKSPAVTIAKTSEWILPIAALSSVVSTYSTIDCANVLPPSRPVEAVQPFAYRDTQTPLSTCPGLFRASTWTPGTSPGVTILRISVVILFN